MHETVNTYQAGHSDETGARFQYSIKSIKGGWVNRYVLLRTENMSPLETHDPSAGTQPLVFKTVDDAERFKQGLAENAAEILQQSSGMPFDQALAFVKAESTDALVTATPANGVLSIDQGVYLVSF